jgi:hypothetical protein
VLVDPQAAEEVVELLGPPEVVVVREQAEQERLAHAPRAQDDEVPSYGPEVPSTDPRCRQPADARRDRGAAADHGEQRRRDAGTGF